MANGYALAIAEAQSQGVDTNIVLATVDAETSFTNKLGDSGNALGYGQVWPQWHNDAFVYACNKYRIPWPSTLPEQQQTVLNNDNVSMAAAVRVIGQDWAAANKDFYTFTHLYVGQGISDADYNRRLNIWLKYQNQYTETYTASPDNAPPNSLLDVNLPATNYGIVANSQKYGNILYGRRYRIIVSNKQNVALDVSQLRCTFNISKTIMQQPNISEVVIYNLNADTENTIIQEGDRVIVEAGYEGDQYGLIFDGDIVQPIRDKSDAVTYRLTLRSIDGDRFMNWGFLGFSMLKGQTARTQVGNILSKVNIPSQLGSISDGLSSAQLTRGKVVFGMAKDYLRQIARSHDASFYLEDGKVNIVKMSDLPEGEVLDLAPDSGLIGVPTQNEYGVTFRCFLNPLIKINTLVHIDNSLIREMSFQVPTTSGSGSKGTSGAPVVRSLDNDGIYRVISVTINGDTRGDSWYCEATCVSQAGLIPALLSLTTGSPY